MIQSTGEATVNCTEQAKPWILAAAILGFSMTFINGSVVYLTLLVAILGVVAIYIFGDQLSQLMNTVGIVPDIQSEMMCVRLTLQRPKYPAVFPPVFDNKQVASLTDHFSTASGLCYTSPPDWRYCLRWFRYWIIEEEAIKK